MERHARLGLPMTLDEIADLLGWSQADKEAHIRALDERPAPELDEARARVAARSTKPVTGLDWRALTVEGESRSAIYAETFLGSPG